MGFGYNVIKKKKINTQIQQVSTTYFPTIQNVSTEDPRSQAKFLFHETWWNLLQSHTSR